MAGEEIKYSQDKGDLYVIDAEGMERKTAILKKR